VQYPSFALSAYSFAHFLQSCSTRVGRRSFPGIPSGQISGLAHLKGGRTKGKTGGTVLSIRSRRCKKFAAQNSAPRVCDFIRPPDEEGLAKQTTTSIEALTHPFEHQRPRKGNTDYSHNTPSAAPYFAHPTVQGQFKTAAFADSALSTTCDDPRRPRPYSATP
jgi:hypothetical protein